MFTGMHLTGVHLIGVHLTGVHLTGVHLTAVHLTGVHLTGVHLTGVHLTGVSLRGVHFIGIHLTGMHLSQACVSYITMRAPLWLSHCGEKGVVRNGCLKRVVPSHSDYIDYDGQSNLSTVCCHVIACCRWVQ
jgi:uncharacterized protein YjbI with pentapeptide repeats